MADIKNLPRFLVSVLPGTAVCVALSIIALAAQFLEERAFEHPYIEALVIAILLGIAVRSIWQPGALWRPGINFSAKLLLEIAVMLLGASISLGAIMASGAALLMGIVFTVIVGLGFATLLIDVLYPLLDPRISYRQS